VRGVRAVGPPPAGDLVGEAGAGEALAEVGEGGVGDVDAKGLDVHGVLLCRAPAVGQPVARRARRAPSSAVDTHEQSPRAKRNSYCRVGDRVRVDVEDELAWGPRCATAWSGTHRRRVYF